MGETNNKVSGETSRWLRVGILTLATLGPVINTFLENARKRAEKLQELQNLQTLQELKALQELKEHPYSQEVLKRGSELIGRGSQVSHALAEQGGKLTQVIAERGSDLAEQGGKFSHVLVERGSDLAEQGNKLSQVIVERGSDLTRELSEHGSKLSQDLAKRSEIITREAAKRGEVITREAAKRGRQATQDLAKRTEQVTDRVGERPFLFWLTFGFGLATAAIVTYQIVRKRFLQHEAEQIQIMHNGHLKGSSPVENSTLARPATQSPTAHKIQIVKDVLASQAPLSTEAEQSTKAPNDYPADSRVLGLVSNRCYYPIDTSLDQLRASEGGKLDLIYFASEDEAMAQGFTAAE